MKERKINQFYFMSLNEIKCHFEKNDFHKNEFSILHIMIVRFAKLIIEFQLLIVKKVETAFERVYNFAREME